MEVRATYMMLFNVILQLFAIDQDILPQSRSRENNETF